MILIKFVDVFITPFPIITYIVFNYNIFITLASEFLFYLIFEFQGTYIHYVYINYFSEYIFFYLEYFFSIYNFFN